MVPLNVAMNLIYRPQNTDISVFNSKVVRLLSIIKTGGRCYLVCYLIINIMEYQEHCDTGFSKCIVLLFLISVNASQSRVYHRVVTQEGSILFKCVFNHHIDRQCYTMCMVHRRHHITNIKVVNHKCSLASKLTMFIQNLDLTVLEQINEH